MHVRETPPGGPARSLRRHRAIAWSTWFAIASLYVLFCLGATLTAYHAGVAQQSMQMAKSHAEQMSEITFEALYHMMLVGAGRDRLQQAAFHLEHAGTELSINFVRGAAIVEEFGEFSDSRALKEQDPNVRAAFRYARPQSHEDGARLRIAYPVVFRPACLECHHQGVDGEVAGVIALTYPTEAFETPRRDAMLPLIAFFVLGFPVVMLITRLATGRR